MNVVFIIRSLANARGAERTFIDKANWLSEKGHSVVMVTYEQGSHPFAFPLSASVRHIDLGCRYFQLYQYSFLRRWVEGERMKRQFRQRLQSVIDEFRTEVVVSTTYSTDFISSIMSVRKQVPVVLESHSAFVGDMCPHSFWRKIQRAFILQDFKKCDLLIALTKGDAACWRKHIHAVAVVPNPLPYYCSDLGDVQRREGRIISVGRLYGPKRFDRLIDAFSMIADRHPQWFVDIYGEGEDHQKLAGQIVSLGLSERVFLKSSTSDIFSEYKQSQFLVVSSDNEGFSLVLVEAMACGIPVVSTSCPFGPPEIVENHVTGLLAELEAKDLSEKMEWMITHEAERRAMGERAHQSVAHYQKHRVMKEWEAAYLSVLM